MKIQSLIFLFVLLVFGCKSAVTFPNESLISLHDIWVLEQLNGKKVTVADFTKEIPNLEINSTTKQFMGYAGCNRMNGTVFFERGLLRFSNIISTRMVCGDNNKENEFLKALQTVTNYQVENRHLILRDKSNNILIFRKVD